MQDKWMIITMERLEAESISRESLGSVSKEINEKARWEDGFDNSYIWIIPDFIVSRDYLRIGFANILPWDAIADMLSKIEWSSKETKSLMGIISEGLQKMTNEPIIANNKESDAYWDEAMKWHDSLEGGRE